MYEIEIKGQPELSEEEQLSCELHSFINLFNIIFGELQIMAELAASPDHFNRLLDLCRDIADNLKQRKNIQQTIKLFDSFRSTLLHDTGKLIADLHDIPDSDKLELREYHRLLIEIIHIAEIRMNELIERIKQPLEWNYCPVTVVQTKLQEVMQTIINNSRGRYSISFTNQQPQPPYREKHYLLWMDWQPSPNGKFYMPVLLHDIIRDLTANARKYSPPGTVIHTRLIDTGKVLELTVEDQGCGIPDEEIERVVNFGYRATNARKQPTYGGGFGLTKAWYLCKKFGGKMWIASALKQGTRIKLQIPYPAKGD